MSNGKKCYVFASVFLLVAIFLNFASVPKANAETVETVIHNNCGDTTEELVGSNYLAQTFIANVDTIVDVGLAVRNKGASTVKFNMALMDSHGTFISTRPQSLAPSALWPYRYISPQYPIDVTVGARYSIWIYPYSGYESNQVYVRGSAVGLENCYPNGSAFSNIFTALNKDFNFVVMGYNKDSNPPADVSGDSSTPPTSSSLESITANTGTSAENNSSSQAAKTTAAKTSNAPKNLAATYDEATRSVKLTWEASSLANLTGYEVYKANSSNNEFKKIIDTKANELTYSDSTINFNDQYIYYVVGISAKARSDNSNNATIVIDDKSLNQTETPAPVVQKSFWQKSSDYLLNHSWTMYALAGLAVILIGILILINLERKRKNRK